MTNSFVPVTSVTPVGAQPGSVTQANGNVTDMTDVTLSCPSEPMRAREGS